MALVPSPFVGSWQCVRYRADLPDLEPLVLAVTEDAVDTLDGLYHIAGHDVTLNGSVVANGRLWTGTFNSTDPVHQGTFAFLIAEDGNSFGGAWTSAAIPSPTAWIGARTP
jgi:hypothetical protein